MMMMMMMILFKPLEEVFLLIGRVRAVVVSSPSPTPPSSSVGRTVDACALGYQEQVTRGKAKRRRL